MRRDSSPIRKVLYAAAVIFLIVFIGFLWKTNRTRRSAIQEQQMLKSEQEEAVTSSDLQKQEDTEKKNEEKDNAEKKNTEKETSDTSSSDETESKEEVSTETESGQEREKSEKTVYNTVSDKNAETGTEINDEAESETEALSELESEEESIYNKEILVVNGSGRQGMAGEWQLYLIGLGYKNVQTGSSFRDPQESTVVYCKDRADGNILRRLFESAVSQTGTVTAEDIGLADTDISPEEYDLVIVLGKNYERAE